MKKNNTKIAKSQALKKFRHNIAVLRRKGLVSEKYDARSVTPTKYLNSVIKEFSSVLEGKATPVKVTKEKAKFYKEEGYVVKNGRVVVPHAENEKVYGTRGDFVVKTISPTGTISARKLGANAKNIEEWEKIIREAYKDIKPNQVLSFSIGGNYSQGKFDNADDMIMILHNYPGYEEEDDNGRIESQGFVNGLVIYTLERGKNMPKNVKTEEQLIAHRNKRAEAYAKYISRRTPEAQEAARLQRKEASKEHRAKLTPEQKKKENDAAKVRARKSYLARIARNDKKGTSND